MTKAVLTIAACATIWTDGRGTGALGYLSRFTAAVLITGVLVSASAAFGQTTVTFSFTGSSLPVGVTVSDPSLAPSNWNDWPDWDHLFGAPANGVVEIP